jgi:hypothetical protein
MNNIVVVTSDNPGDLPGMISRAAGSGEDSIPWKNVITFTGDSAVKDKFFMQRYNSLDTEKESFLVGVDESGVGDDKYLRIVEMICMALDQAFQNRMINHPRINVRTLRAEGNSLWSGRRIYIYVPEPELIDINEIPYVYKAQSKVLQSA